MNHTFRLLDFLYQLIDSQISKYTNLATTGVGPDARLNAKLVLEEVNELFELADSLIADLDNKEKFLSVYHQVRFYVEQEHTRLYAGWLLDENNIHTGGLARNTKQSDELHEMAAQFDIDISNPAVPVTSIQKQCEHDSGAIAHRVLDLAKKIQENPDMELEDAIPEHARAILRKHATTRYNDPKFATPILNLSEKYHLFLESSSLEVSTSVLQGKEAKEHQAMHTALLKEKQEQYRGLNPKSKLFEPVPEAKKVTISQPSSPYSKGNLFFYGGVALASMCTCMLVTYFTQSSANNPFQFR